MQATAGLSDPSRSSPIDAAWSSWFPKFIVKCCFICLLCGYNSQLSSAYLLLSVEDMSSTIDAVMKSLGKSWRDSLISGGSNNSTTLAGMKRVFSAMDRVTPFGEDSVLLDLGSGAGLPCIYTALKYGIRTFGVEVDAELVLIARQFAQRAGVSSLVTFVCSSIDRLTAEWYTERGVTHVYSYDEVFLPATVAQMFMPISKLPLTGASTKRYKSRWPRSLELQQTIDRVMLAGGRSGFAFGIWKTQETGSRDLSPERG